MDAETFTSTVNAFRKKVPFSPFTITLVNSERHEVDHPDAIMVRDGAGVFFAPGGVMVIFDHQGVDEVVGDLSGRQAG